MYKLTGVTKDYPKGRGTVHALRGGDLPGQRQGNVQVHCIAVRGSAPRLEL